MKDYLEIIDDVYRRHAEGLAGATEKTLVVSEALRGYAKDSLVVYQKTMVQAYKDGFQSASDSIKAANEIVQNKEFKF